MRKPQQMRSLALGVALASSAVAPTTLAADFVLTASKWGASQDAAVKAAGGKVLWKHGPAGIAAVSSDDSLFLSRVSKNRAFTSAAEDMVVQWQDPTPLASNITPNDEWLYAYQWNMRAMEAPGAWSAGCTGKGARVAIIDGGIDPTHPDLAPNMDTACSASFVPNQAYNTDTGTFWHGMHVAGIVAAADDGTGVIGVAPEATLVGVKSLHNGSGSFSWIIAGILYASDPAAFGRPACGKADIINMSLGATFPKRGGSGILIGAMAKAVNYAASKGTLVVSSAGNDAIDLGQAADTVAVPAQSGSGLAITSTGPVDIAGIFGQPGNPRRIASYSNYGEGVTYVAAPGGDYGITATVEVTAPAEIAGVNAASIAAYGPAPAGETGDVVLWEDATNAIGPDPHDACDGGADPDVAGKIALIHRGSCLFHQKSLAAQASGAIGVIVSNNRVGAMPVLGNTDGLADPTIPSVGISQADGAAIESGLGSSVLATLGNNPAGVLDQVLSACQEGWCFAVGTSMSAPAASGVAALIKAKNPGMSLGSLKQALAATADDEGKVGKDQFYGNGFVNARRACTAN